MRAMKSKRAPNALFFGVALVAMSSIAFGVGRQLEFKPGFNVFSPSFDIDEGKKAAAQVDKQAPLLNDPSTIDYVNRLGRRLASFAPNNRDYPFTFRVINTADINAFALPGGFIYVNRGTIEAAQDEAQLAGVISHEIGHVVMRHATHQATEMLIPEIGLSVFGGILSRGGAVGQFLDRVGGFGLQSALLKNSRNNESQADSVGTYIAYHAGYDPHAMAQFFQIIEQKYPQKTLQFFSDHPNPGNRIAAVDKEIPELGPEQNWKEDSPEFQSIKQRVKGLPPAPKALAAAPTVAGGPPPAPSPNLSTYSGRGFSLKYPDNWQVYGSPNTSVVIAPPGGIFQTPQGSAQAYGAEISISQPSSQAADWKLEDATRQLVQSLVQSNPALRVTSESRITVTGLPALATQLENDSPLQGKKEIDSLITLRTDKSLVALTFIAPREEYPTYKPAFDAMLSSLQIP